MLTTTLHRSICTMLNIHRLWLELLGYVITFDPLTFVSQCQCQPNRMPLSLVFFMISMHFIVPPKIPYSPTIFKVGSFHCLSKVKPWDLMTDLRNHLQMFYIQSFWIMLRFSCLIAIASTKLADVYSLDNFIASSLRKGIYDLWAFYFHVPLLR